jgi:hypothetical protein
MTPNDIVQMVSTVGFPIGMCLILAWYVKTRDEAHIAQVTAITEMHKEESKAMTEAIQNNTLTIQKLVDILTKGE